MGDKTAHSSRSEKPSHGTSMVLRRYRVESRSQTHFRSDLQRIRALLILAEGGQAQEFLAKVIRNRIFLKL